MRQVLEPSSVLEGREVHGDGFDCRPRIHGPHFGPAGRLGQWGFPANRGVASRISSRSIAREHMVMATTVLVVDDHSGFRASARRLLECEGYRVVGEAEDGESALTLARELKPQIALVDVYLPDTDGIDVASRLSELDDAPAVILISSHERTELEPLVAGSGARGFVSKAKLSRDALEQLV